MIENTPQLRSFIQSALKERGWTVKDLSKKADVSYQSLYKLVAGKTDSVRTQTLNGLSEALGIPYSEFLVQASGGIQVSSLLKNVLVQDLIELDPKKLTQVMTYLYSQGFSLEQAMADWICKMPETVQDQVLRLIGKEPKPENINSLDMFLRLFEKVKAGDVPEGFYYEESEMEIDDELKNHHHFKSDSDVDEENSDDDSAEPDES